MQIRAVNFQDQGNILSYNGIGYRKILDRNDLSITLYKAYEVFSIHGYDVSKDDVVVLELFYNGREDETHLVAYTQYGRIDEILMDSEREKTVYKIRSSKGETEYETLKQWFYQLPLTISAPYIYEENKSGVLLSPGVFNALDPVWTNEKTDYYEIENLMNDVWEISLDL